jgi:endonuclease/exonuclease/phosphatase family metal-dependent hydrolase
MLNTSASEVNVSSILPNYLDPAAPPAVAMEMAELSTMLDAVVPRKRLLERNLLIATWNIKNFGSLTTKWEAGPRDTPKREYRALWAIAEIISRFDIIALQEVTGDLRALRTLMKTLGPQWRFLMTDITLGSAGSGERMAFVFDASRVELSGLAGELVVPPEWLAEIGRDAFDRQFARTPYAVSFRAGRATVILVTLHVLYGRSATERLPELRAIARWMADWARRSNRWHHNLMALGDFNIDRHDDALWQAFTSTGLVVPDVLNSVRRSIFADAGNPQRDKYYDQIAWFTSDNRRLIDLELKNGGGVDFVPWLYRDLGLTRAQMQYRVSDHYPLWVEFACPSGDG